jgi:hypothetical protein
MKIRKSAAHYKMTAYIFDYPSHSLCLYFWQSVWSVLVIFLFFPLVLLIVFLFALTPFISVFLEPLRSAGFAAAIIEVVMLVGFWLEYRKQTYPKKHQEPTVIGEYIRAKKEKICPILEFVD